MDDFYSGGNGTSYLTLDQWKSAYRLDAFSRRSPLTFTSNIDSNLRFEYNDTATATVVPLDATYTDLAAKVHSGLITVNPFASVVLLKGSGRDDLEPDDHVYQPGLQDLGRSAVRAHRHGLFGAQSPAPRSASHPSP